MSSPDGCIAVLNAGSSSLKFAVYDSCPGERLLFKGKVEEIGVEPRMVADDAAGRRVVEERRWPAAGFDHQAATLEVVRTVLELTGGATFAGIGHRVVHGGMHYAQPVRVDAGVIAYLAELAPLAPLHQPHNLAPIEAIAAAAPHIPQVACFDTAFHRTQPAIAQMFALPRRFTEAGVRRYGFHGLSYEYVTSELRELAPELADRRVIIAHLGNGASLCAVRGGRSVASTMGFTAVDGLMMGTRTGALDPGVLIHLMDAYGLDARALEAMIYKQSGLLGVSGVSSDMRALRASPEPAAAEAIALFVYRVVREIGSAAAALGGVDAIVFTGGIGENDAQTRAEIAAGCCWLGLGMDDHGRGQGARRISRQCSLVEAWVIPTDEERMIARHTRAVLGLGRDDAREEAPVAKTGLHAEG
jgi:acetate kinase